MFTLAISKCYGKVRVPSFRFFGTTELLKNLLFSKSFQSLKGSHSIFLEFCNRMDVKKSQRAPLYSFRHCEIFEMNNFCLKIRFSQAQHAMSDFCFLVGAFSFKEKSPTITVASFFSFFSSDHRAHRVCTTFYRN